MARRPTLRELARSRGCVSAGVFRLYVEDHWRGVAHHPRGSIIVNALTLRSTTAGLRAALEALPARKERRG